MSLEEPAYDGRMGERNILKLVATMVILGPPLGLTTMTLYLVARGAAQNESFAFFSIDQFLPATPAMLMWSYVVGLFPALICAGLSAFAAWGVRSRVVRIALAPVLGAISTFPFTAAFVAREPDIWALSLTFAPLGAIASLICTALVDRPARR